MSAVPPSPAAAPPADRTWPTELVPEEDVSDVRVLVIDDTAGPRAMLEAMLRRGGFREIRVAAGGREGLQLAYAWSPDIVVTDIVMPEVSGFDVCRWLRAETRFRDIPIIAQTAMDDVQNRSEIFAAGATDLVIKPLNSIEFVSRVRIHAQNRRMLRRLTEERRRVAAEIAAARAMQLAIVPGAADLEACGRRHGLDLASVHVASDGLSGDLWGLEDLPDGRLRLYCADFVGHGVGAALNTFRLHAYLLASRIQAAGPGEWLGTVNRFLVQTLPVGQFATLICAEIEPRAGRVAIASAGAPCPALRIDGGFDLVALSGLPAGIAADAAYEAVHLPFPPGAGLFLYSDAVVETPDPVDPLLSPEALVRALDETAATTAKRAVSAIHDRLLGASPGGLEDDLTMILVRNGRSAR